MDRKDIVQKIEWVKNNEDINYQGESDDFRTGFVTALEWIIEQ